MPTCGSDYNPARDAALNAARKKWFAHYRAKFPGLPRHKYEEIVSKRVSSPTPKGSGHLP